MYKKFLTFLAIVFSIAIIVMLSYLGYGLYEKYSKNHNAEQFLDNEFEKYIEEDNKEDNKEDYSEVPEEQPTTNNQTKAYYNPYSYSESGVLYYYNHPVVGKISIPRTGIKYPILGDNNNASAIEVAVLKIYGPEINEPGNVVIAGHNYNNGLFFGNNKKLQVGDKIYITDMTGRELEYTIYNKYYTPESDNSYFSRQTNGQTEITLYTCDATGANRLIIFARAE